MVATCLFFVAQSRNSFFLDRNGRSISALSRIACNMSQRPRLEIIGMHCAFITVGSIPLVVKPFMNRVLAKYFANINSNWSDISGKLF